MGIPILPIIQGMGVTMKHIFKRPVTVPYPDKRRTETPRFRGRIYLVVDNCIGCTMCSQACPNGSCYMTDWKAPYETPNNKKDKFPAVEISKCMYCGLCEEVCPTDAIRLGPEWETALEVRDFDYHPDRLAQTEHELGRGSFYVLEDEDEPALKTNPGKETVGVHAGLAKGEDDKTEAAA